MGGEPDRQARLGEQLAANAVGERDLGGRDQVLLALGAVVAVVAFAAPEDPEHVVLELGQLAGAFEHLAVDDVGRVALGVAMLLGLHVEHELGERAMQSRDRPAQEREARARELGAGVEIEAERRADVDVIARREVELARPAPAPHLDVRALVGADRDARVGQVRQRHQLLVELELDRRQPLGRAVELGADLRDLGHRRRAHRRPGSSTCRSRARARCGAPAAPRCGSAAPCARSRARRSGRRRGTAAATARVSRRATTCARSLRRSEMSSMWAGRRSRGARIVEVGRVANRARAPIVRAGRGRACAR